MPDPTERSERTPDSTRKQGLEGPDEGAAAESQSQADEPAIPTEPSVRQRAKRARAPYNIPDSLGALPTSPVVDIVRAAQRHQDLYEQIARSPVLEIIRSAQRSQDVIDRLANSSVQDVYQSIAARSDVLGQLGTSSLQESLRHLNDLYPKLSAGVDLAKLAIESPVAEMARRLEAQNAAAFRSLTAFNRAGEAARAVDRLSDRDASATLERTWHEQQEALSALQDTATDSAVHAQALIEAVEELPEGPDKEALVEATKHGAEVTAAFEVLVPLLQDGLDAQKEAAIRDIRLGELTSQLVTSSETLVRVTSAGQAEAKRRDDANRDLSNDLKTIARTTLGVALITLFVAIGALARDLTGSGATPLPPVIVVITAAPPTGSPPSATAPIATPAALPTPSPSLPATATPFASGSNAPAGTAAP